jgi:hypothetical protein
MEPAIMGIMTGMLALMIPFWAIYWSSRNARAKYDDRREARRAYERLVIEKLDVIKTAVAMGYKDEELDALDRRLEKLVGGDKLGVLVDSKGKEIPAVTHELLDTDFDRELERVRQQRQQSKAGGGM